MSIRNEGRAILPSIIEEQLQVIPARINYVITEEIDLAAVSGLLITQPSSRSQSEFAGARSYNNEHLLESEEGRVLEVRGPATKEKARPRRSGQVIS